MWSLVDVSRLQFAVTVLFHFLFVPLTVGMVWILLIMESVYVMTGKEIYKNMTRFWGKLFAINFAMGVTTGIPLEIQFGTNWAHYAYYVGDVFGTPMAIEGMMAFFLESTFVGLFFFGWERLSAPKHLLVTMLMALGTNLSALWILIANAWMQHPVGATFNLTTERMELTDFMAVIFNPDAQDKFVHTVSAGYVTAATFVLAISAYYILKNKNLPFATRSFRIAASFGLASVLSVIVLGDESGYTVAEAQQTKMAAIEAMWHTEPAPASFNLVAAPNERLQKNDWSLEVPWVMGIIGTRSLDKTIPGIFEIKEKNKQRMLSGIKAIDAEQILHQHPNDSVALQQFMEHQKDLGFGLLLQSFENTPHQFTPTELQLAVDSSIPRVVPMFWGFRLMVLMGGLLLSLFALAFRATLANSLIEHKKLLRFAVWMLPAPWIASELGWFVAEFGRQPWTVYGILPTRLSTSSLAVGDVWLSLTGFVIFYTGLFVVEMWLMVKYVRMGPTIVELSGNNINHPYDHLSIKEIR